MLRVVASVACVCLLVRAGSTSAQPAQPPRAKPQDLYSAALLHLARGDSDAAYAAARQASGLRPGWKPYEQLLALLEPAARRNKLRAYALTPPRDDEASVEQLAQYLKKGGEDEESRAWLLYCWLADRIAYDVRAFLSGEYRSKDQSPAAVLKERQAVCDGYSKLYDAVGKAMGLEVLLVSGYAKGVGYKPGVDFEQLRHSWNAVKIGGKWRLVDATWGAGSIQGGRFEKRLDDFFFCPPPQALIVTHYPRKEEDQLLESPLPLDQFKAWPKVDARSLVRCGFSPADIQDKVAHGIDTVETYRASCPFKVEAPLERGLDTRKSYTIKVEGVAVQDVAILHAGKLRPSSRRGDTFTCVCRGLEGDIAVVLRPLGQKEYNSILKYRGSKGP